MFRLMMHSALAPLAWLVSGWLGVPSLMSMLVVLRKEARADSVRLWLLSLLEHATVAGQAMSCLCLLHALPAASETAWLGGMLYALYVALLCLDLALFLVCRMRMQWQLFKLTESLTGFADALPWRGALAGSGAAWMIALAWGHAASASAGDLLARPAVVVSTLFWVPLLMTRWVLNRYLPPRFALQWNNRVLATEIALLGTLLKRLPSRQDSGHKTAWELLRSGENALELGEAYPLWRRSHHGRWPKRTNVRLEPGEKPHVVMLFLESFRGLDVGALGGAHGVTPHFDRLSREGVLWRNFFANGNTTSRAMVASFYGVLPPFGEVSTQASQNPPPLVGMPQMFTKLGYKSAYFCDGPMDWENKRNFFLTHGFKSFFGAPSIRLAYPEAPVAGVWRFEDEFLMRFHADWLARQRDLGVPTFSSVLTVTNHTPFFARPHFDKPQVDIDPQSDYYRFLRTMMYTDRCLGLYTDLLRQRGLDKNVILCILGDHGQHFDPHTHGLQFSGAYRDNLLRVPMLLWAPGRVAPEVIDEVASQTDLLATMMDMFNVDGLHHAVGTSMLRRCDSRRAITQHQFSPAFSSVRQGDHRYTYLFETNQSELYDVRRDPLEKDNLAGQQPQRTADWAASVRAVREAGELLHKNKAFAPMEATSTPPAPAMHLPPEFPSTAPAAQKRRVDLATLVANNQATALEQTEKAMLDEVWGDQQNPQTWLHMCQLIFQYTHCQDMGEMLKEDDAAVAALEHRVVPGKTNQAQPG